MSRWVASVRLAISSLCKKQLTLLPYVWRPLFRASPGVSFRPLSVSSCTDAGCQAS
jgi:hypothetical protein